MPGGPSECEASTPFGYTGQYQDNESGLVYLRARYYDPATQQFLSVDPLLAQTEQAYAYVGGSPINGIDPSGLCAAFPNPFDPNSCMVLGAQTEAGHWVIAGGVAAAAVATGGFICVAGGCQAAGAALGIGGTVAAAEEEPLAEALTQEVGTGATCATEGPSIGKAIYRVYGGKAGPWGRSWTPVDPRTVMVPPSVKTI